MQNQGKDKKDVELKDINLKENENIKKANKKKNENEKYWNARRYLAELQWLCGRMVSILYYFVKKLKEAHALKVKTEGTSAASLTSIEADKLSNKLDNIIEKQTQQLKGKIQEMTDNLESTLEPFKDHQRQLHNEAINTTKQCFSTTEGKNEVMTIGQKVLKGLVSTDDLDMLNNLLSSDRLTSFFDRVMETDPASIVMQKVEKMQQEVEIAPDEKGEIKRDIKIDSIYDKEFSKYNREMRLNINKEIDSIVKEWARDMKLKGGVVIQPYQISEFTKVLRSYAAEKLFPLFPDTDKKRDENINTLKIASGFKKLINETEEKLNNLVKSKMEISKNVETRPGLIKK
jgi:gas vesicle protein